MLRICRKSEISHLSKSRSPENKNKKNTPRAFWGQSPRLPAVATGTGHGLDNLFWKGRSFLLRDVSGHQTMVRLGASATCWASLRVFTKSLAGN